MIFVCGGLALLSLVFSAMNRRWIADFAAQHAGIEVWLNLLIFKLAAVPISILGCS